ncbi:MAG: Rossmann-fold NAD(P)-binding domain-containing protein [Planctomycetota bacterium]
MFVSSTAVYGQADGEWVDEDSPTEPEGFNGRVLLEAEALLDACPSRTTSLRLGGIYGPGRTRLVESVLNGEMDLPAGPAAHTNRIHRDDAALAIVHLLELDEPDSIYNGVDRDPADRREVLTWLADRLDVPRPTVGSGTSASSRGNKRVKSDRLVESGFEFRYPTFREGYESVIAGLGASHWSPGEFGE